MRGTVETRILVAFDDEYHAYRGVIAAGISVLRPRTEVAIVGLDQLEQEVERFDPHVVICSQPDTADPGSRVGWVELSLDPDRPAKVCVGGRCSEFSYLMLEGLLAVIDEAEELIRTKNRAHRLPGRKNGS